MKKDTRKQLEEKAQAFSSELEAHAQALNAFLNGEVSPAFMKTTIKLNGLTAKQQARLQKAEAKLPNGFTYLLHTEQDNGSSGDVWGISVRNDSLNNSPIGHVQKNMLAHTSCDEKHVETVRLLLNRAASALWNKQPAWIGKEKEYFFA